MPDSICESQQSIILEKTDDESDRTRKAKNLQKKLREIQELKQKKSAGTALELNQLQKIENEASLLEELASLNILEKGQKVEQTRSK